MVLLDRKGLTGTKVLEVSDKDALELDCPNLNIEVGKEKELNMADGNNLSNFLKFALEYYPADHYGLIIWGHGTGFRSASRAVAVDDSSAGLSMSKTELRKAICSGMKNKLLDFIAFDTCYSAEIEEAYELKNCVEYFAGNTGAQNLCGWNYETWFSNPFENYSSGQEILAFLMKQYEGEGEEKFSLLDLKHISTLFASFDAFCKELSLKIETKTEAEKVRAMLLSPLEVRRYLVLPSYNETSPLYLDMENFVERMCQYDDDLSPYGKSVTDALYRTVVRNVKGQYPLGLYFCNVDFSDNVDMNFSAYCIQGSAADSLSLFVKDSAFYVLTKIKSGTLLDKIFSNYDWR